MDELLEKVRQMPGVVVAAAAPEDLIFAAVALHPGAGLAVVAWTRVIDASGGAALALTEWGAESEHLIPQEVLQALDDFAGVEGAAALDERFFAETPNLTVTERNTPDMGW